jgi:glutamate dehydrogenase (NADP+)
MSRDAEQLEHFMAGLRRRNPAEHEFHQAVFEVASDILPFIADKPAYREAQILERLTEPDRIVIFRVSWVDDEGNVRANRGYRVQCSNAIGPYKGGLRFHPSVSLSILKFLAFEQVFKNSLTGLPMGGAKGGSDFNPKEKSSAEVMRFCQAFMSELFRHIGPYTDVPAGDIGVGGREISYLFGQYKRLTNEFTGVLTGKGLAFGGSEIRVEATGYGATYLLKDMLARRKEQIEGKRVAISGSGNVAQYAAEKVAALGGRVVTMSDSSGFVYDAKGIKGEKLEYIKRLKNEDRGRISNYARKYRAKFFKAKRPWGVPCDVAMPCATQNEISAEDAGTLVANGCEAVVEGANMPTSAEAVALFLQAKIPFAPGKAANAGGVAVSGLEMTQNSMRLQWSREDLDQRLQAIMHGIHERCVAYGAEKGYVNYARGANIAGFIKVADAMLAYGVM